MATTTRRVFLEVIGAGAAVTTLELGCVALVSEAGGPSGAAGSTAIIGGDATGGAAVIGIGSTGGQDGFGTGGVGSGDVGTGGSAAGTGGARATGGSMGSGGAQAQSDGGVGGRAGVDARPADATGAPVLGPGDLLAGNVSSLAVGALNAVANRPVGIARDAMGVYALTLVCTHQGCTANPAGAVGARQINCPCHGSQFDRNGAVIRGPAGRPLVHYGVTVDAGGNIIIHQNMQVAANTRTVA